MPKCRRCNGPGLPAGSQDFARGVLRAATNGAANSSGAAIRGALTTATRNQPSGIEARARRRPISLFAAESSVDDATRRTPLVGERGEEKGDPASVVGFLCCDEGKKQQMRSGILVRVTGSGSASSRRVRSQRSSRRGRGRSPFLVEGQPPVIKAWVTGSSSGAIRRDTRTARGVRISRPRAATACVNRARDDCTSRLRSGARNAPTLRYPSLRYRHS